MQITLRRFRTSSHATNNLSFQKGEWGLSAPLKFFEHIHRSSRERSTQKLCLKSLSSAVGTLRSSPRMAEQGFVLTAHPGAQAHPSPHSLNAHERLVPVLGVCAWPGELGDTYVLPQMGFLKTCKVRMHIISTLFSTYNKFIHSRSHFPHWLWFGSPSCVLVCRRPESDCGTAFFEPLASEKVTCLRHEI